MEKKRKATAQPQGKNGAISVKGVAPSVVAEPKEKHPGGRPPFFTSPYELEVKIQEYFDSCWIDKITETENKETGEIVTSNVRYQIEPYTIAGLAHFLGFSSRQSFYDYKNKDEEFSYVLTRARFKIESLVEGYLLTGKNSNGPLSWLKNHAGYRDTQGIEFPDENGKPQRIGSDTERSARLLFLLEQAEKRAKA